jgi:hypothetical protein
MTASVQRGPGSRTPVRIPSDAYSRGPGFADAPEPELDMGEADRPDEAPDQDLEEPDEKQGHQPDA